jgi:hypothetical protein
LVDYDKYPQKAYMYFWKKSSRRNLGVFLLGMIRSCLNYFVKYFIFSCNPYTTWYNKTSNRGVGNDKARSYQYVYERSRKVYCCNRLYCWQ